METKKIKRNTKGLIPFKAGESGNPDGRPVGAKNRSTIFKKWIEVAAKVQNPADDTECDGTLEDKIAISLIDAAIKGDVQAAKEILDSVYGRSKQSIEHSGSIATPITFVLDERFNSQNDTSIPA